MKKKTFLIFLAILLPIILFLVWILIKDNQKITSTGANITPQSQEELKPYEEMYSLLESGNIKQDTFEIEPIKQKRNFNVYLRSPYEISRKDFEKWLIDNNYSEIPKDKFVFINF